MKISEYAKAVAAGAVAFLGGFDAATAVGSVGGDTVTGNEWVRIAVVTVAAAVAVYLIPNEAPSTRTATVTVESTQTGPQSSVMDHPV